MGIRVTSVATAIVAAVAMYFIFSIFKPWRRVALRAPPVPTNAVINPVTLPPTMNVPVFWGNFNPGFAKNAIDVIIRKIPSVSFSAGWAMIPLRKAPSKLSSRLGTSD